MSTKIYGGLIATELEPFGIHKKIREVLEPLFYERFVAGVAKAQEHVGELYPDVFKDVNWKAKRYAEMSTERVSESTIKVCEYIYDLVTTLQRDPLHTFSDLDFGYDVVLLPNGLSVHNSPLILVFSERAGDDYRQALIDAGVARDYSYWNNSDKPGDISDSEWDLRRKAWDKLDVPARDGLNITMPTRFESWWKIADVRRDAS